jgi:hypothetical protein
MSEEREQDILEENEDDVEAHQKHHGATAEPTEDDENDVEAHQKSHI